MDRSQRLPAGSIIGVILQAVEIDTPDSMLGIQGKLEFVRDALWISDDQQIVGYAIRSRVNRARTACIMTAEEGVFVIPSLIALQSWPARNGCLGVIKNLKAFAGLFLAPIEQRFKGIKNLLHQFWGSSLGEDQSPTCVGQFVCI